MIKCFNLQEYDSFINSSNRILSQPIESENFNVLLTIMTVINDIKKRDENADQLFDGLKKDLFTLLQYDVHVSKKILTQFFDLPEKWIALRKIATNIQHEITNIQSHQVDSIKRKILYFSQLVKLFRSRFTSMEVIY